MKIFLENVNINSSSGPNHFGRKLKKFLEKTDNTCVLTPQICDSHLCFIQSNCSIQNTPLILRLDSIYFDPTQNIDFLNSPIRKTYERANGVIFQSEFSKNLVFNYFGKHDDYKVIRNGADQEFIDAIEPLNSKQIDKFDKVWSCAASWYYDQQLTQPRTRKRLKENIAYFLEFSDENDCLIIAGDVPPRDRSNSNKIFYTGNLNTPTLFSLYKRSDYFIHLSSYESCPNVVIDARAAGCEIICSSLGGTAEIAGAGATVVQDFEWDFTSKNLKIENNINFSKIYKNEFNSEYDMVEVSKKYEDYMLKFNI
jgi:glycosyltransferase involved in cell wall biosynthesis